MMYIRKLAILLLMGALGCHQTEKNNSVSNDSETAKIRLMDLKGQPVRLENYKGKTVFINFWATWCKPCVEEMPSIEKAQAMMNDKEIVFLLASSESIEGIKAFSINHNYKFKYVHLENGESLNIQALPTTFIVNPGGKLVFSEMGSRNWGESDNINLIKKITQQHE
ncbi:MAG: TlpA disulfide reductase family protein [Bacteroidota bacterium]